MGNTLQSEGSNKARATSRNSEIINASGRSQALDNESCPIIHPKKWQLGFRYGTSTRRHPRAAAPIASLGVLASCGRTTGPRVALVMPLLSHHGERERERERERGRSRSGGLPRADALPRPGPRSRPRLGLTCGLPPPPGPITRRDGATSGGDRRRTAHATHGEGGGREECGCRHAEGRAKPPSPCLRKERGKEESERRSTFLGGSRKSTKHTMGPVRKIFFLGLIRYGHVDVNSNCWLGKFGPLNRESDGCNFCGDVDQLDAQGRVLN
jgi:hypothetical protein